MRLNFLSILKAKCTKNTKWDRFPLLSAPSSQLVKKKKKRSWSCRRCVSTFQQPLLLLLQAADHGHQPNTGVALTLSDNDVSPDQGVYFWSRAEERGQGHGKGLPKCHVGRPQQPRHRTPSSAGPVEPSVSECPRAQPPSLKMLSHSFKHLMCFTQI